MRKVWTIFRRDILRLIRVPSAWVIIAGLTFLPALYAWFNIYGFWDPYSNTGEIRVAVANEDKGTDSATLGKLDLGKQIVDTLKKNHQLGWQFMDRAQAMDCVESGDCYAAIVIPDDFSKKTASLLTDTDSRPELDYYVNEKANAVAPKITDVGANTVDQQVNNTFVSTASNVIAKIVNTTNTKIEQQSNATVEKTGAQLAKTENNLKETRQMIASLRNTLAGAKDKTDAARQALTQVEQATQSAGQGLDTANSLLGTTQRKLNTFATDASSQLDTGTNLFMQASNRASTQATSTLNSVVAATGRTQAALDQLQGVNSSTATILQELGQISTGNAALDQQIKDTISSLQDNNTSVASALAAAQQQNTNIANTANSALGSINAFGSSTQGTLDALNKARGTINSSALPQMNNALTSLALAGSPLGASINGEDALAAQTDLVLSQIGEISGSTSTTLASTDELLGTFMAKISNVRTDLGTLQNMNILKEFLGTDGSLDPQRIANFMLSPTVLDTHTLYPVATYGSAMAPLLTSLALWVGTFMLMVLIRLEVDPEGIEELHATTTQTYMARFLLLACISLMQALTVSIGDLIIGVQCVNPFLFILTSVLAGFSYLSIAYALSTTFMHVGKALVVAMVMVQIPGASGLYPIEMMPGFYRALYPFFPFTYAIDAYRETIAGFYDAHWIKAIGMLALFAAVFFFVGLVIRPWMANVNHLFAREIEESDMLVGEEVYLPKRRFSLTQVIQILADQSGYRQQVEARGERFARLYPRLLKGALIAGIVVPVALSITFSLTEGTKLVALASWIIWILLIMLFLMVIEYIRDTLSRQRALGDLSDASLRDILLAEGRRKGKDSRSAGIQMADAAYASAVQAHAARMDDAAAQDDGDTDTETDAAADTLDDLQLGFDGQLDEIRGKIFGKRTHHEGRHAQ